MGSSPLDEEEFMSSEMRSTGYLLLQQNENNGLNGAFHELRVAEELFDVTLACEDETLEAHKVILSASSSFFQKCFQQDKAIASFHFSPWSSSQGPGRSVRLYLYRGD